MNVDNQTFFNAWVEEVQPVPTSSVDGGAAEKTVTRNTLIDKWVEEINNAAYDELKKINDLIDWLEHCSSDAGMVL